MNRPFARWFAGAWAVFEKDLRLELRTRHAVGMLLMFVPASILLIFFAAGQEPLSPRIQSGLLWIVVLFAASIGLGRSFVSEADRDTALFLRMHTRASMVYAGKLLFNFLLILALDVVAVLTMIALLQVQVAHGGLLASALLLGSLGLAGATTLLAALIAQAATRGPLLPVLLFPLLAPLLMSAVTATRHAFEGGLGWSASAESLTTLAAFAGVAITAAVLLFDFVWND